MTTSLSAIVDCLNQLLENDKYRDEFLNGLQVDSGNPQISKVAGAVDAGLSVFESAVAAGADLLITHHGLLDLNSQRIIGIHGKKIQTLMKGGCSLYTSHLPLDGNLEVGNAAELARYLDLIEISPYFVMDGRSIGVSAKFKEEKSLTEISAMLAKLEGGSASPMVLNFGSQRIKSVGIVTGSGSSAIGASAEAGFDLLISGESKQKAYHLAKEHQTNVIFAGHYATETFGVKALLRHLAQRFQISTVFVHEPTGI
jgi:dinuclear metal center YbgI/SA1388 family protein